MVNRLGLHRQCRTGDRESRMRSFDSPIATTNNRRLAGVMERLRSPFAGERAVAALLATRHIDALGLSWADVAAAADVVATRAASILASDFPSSASQPHQASWCRKYVLGRNAPWQHAIGGMARQQRR